jgi:DNA excision repair protein ERCC-2
MCSNHTQSYFPYPSLRPGQLSLIHAIQEEVANGTHLCVEAANGFGKTIAALSGVLPLLKVKNFGIVYVARTHKQLDRVMQELRLITESTGCNGVVLRGRAATCLNPFVRKHGRSAQLAMFICSQLKRAGRCEYYQNLIKKKKRERDYFGRFYHTPLTGLEFRRKCESEKVCPYELSKQLLPIVTVVATTYNQIFDPHINPMFFEAFGHPPSRTILILDEAHNLPRIGVELASSSLSLSTITQSKKEANRYNLSSLKKFLLTLQNRIEDLLEEYSEREIRIDPIELTSHICRIHGIDDFKSFSNSMQQIGSKVLNQLLTEGKPPISYIYSVARFFVNWCFFIPRNDAAYFVTRNGRGLSSTRLEIVALDPRIATVPVLNSCHASVHLSGTLEPTSAHIDLVGLPEETQDLNLPSPFKQNQIFPVISLGVTTAMKYRTPPMFQKIARRVLEVSRATPHNVGVFVPSYSVLQSLLDTGLEKISNRELFIEKPKRSSSENDALIQKFKRKAEEGAMLLGVMGGRNSEGEDYPGDEMETVVIVGVPYARPNPKETVRIEYFESQFPQKGRLYGYQLPALRSASQAAGRSVRKLEDRGAIVFLDDRYATPICKRLLPNWINENLRGANDADGVLYTHLKSFYSLS